MLLLGSDTHLTKALMYYDLSNKYALETLTSKKCTLTSEVNPNLSENQKSKKSHYCKTLDNRRIMTLFAGFSVIVQQRPCRQIFALDLKKFFTARKWTV
jgi:hypothetical protein